MLDSALSHPYVSLGAIVLGIAVICAVIALLRGVFRLMIHTAILTLALWVGYWVWMHTPGWGEMIFRPPPRWVPFVLPVIAGFATILTIRKFLKFLFAPANDDEENPRSSGGKLFSIAFSLIPTALLTLIAALLIRHIGTLRLVEDPNTRAISVLWKDVIDQCIPPAWLQRLDPITDPLRLTLAQWISLASEPHIPRAIPVSDPQALDAPWMADPKWRSLLEQGRYGEILRDPAMEKALSDPQIKKMLEEIQRHLAK
jgi:hypothetical protein